MRPLTNNIVILPKCPEHVETNSVEPEERTHEEIVGYIRWKSSKQH
jgi:hypothetical protein